MSNDAKIINTINKIRQNLQDIKLVKQSVVIFPFQITGYIDVTNNGISSQLRNVNDYETFKRVWTGNDALNLQWKGSLIFKQNETTKSISGSFQMGEYLLGMLSNNTSENQIDKDQSFSEYTSQQSKDTFSLRIPYQYGLTDNYLFYMYKIPELAGDTLLRITRLEKEYIGRDVVAYDVEFESLNQDLANTGKAKQQNVMPSAPGQGYISPQIVDEIFEIPKEWVDGIDYKQLVDGRYVIANKDKAVQRPIKKCVVKQYGVTMLNNVSFFGRRVLSTDPIETFGRPTLIFPMNLVPPSTPNLYRSQSVENNFYFIQKAAPTIWYSKDFMANLKAGLSAVNPWKYQGYLMFDAAQFRATNPSDTTDDAEGVLNYKNQLFGQLEKVGSVVVVKPWVVDLPKLSVINNMTYGSDATYVSGGNKRIEDHLFDNYWISKKYNVLPISLKNTLSYGSTLNMSVGASVTKEYWQAALILTAGISAALLGRFIGPYFDGYNGIMPCSFVDAVTNQFKNTIPSNKSLIPLEMFNGEDGDSPMSQFLDTATMNVGFEADLTNIISTPRLTKSITLDCVGQKTYEDGTNILPSGETFLMNGDAMLVPISNPNEGFIIDSFNINAIHCGDFSMEFMDKDNNIVWSGIYQSEGKWTKSTREINTFRDTSIFGRENMFFGEPLPWPKPLEELKGDLNKRFNLTTGMSLGPYWSAEGQGGVFAPEFLRINHFPFIEMWGSYHSYSIPPFGYEICVTPNNTFESWSEFASYYDRFSFKMAVNACTNQTNGNIVFENNSILKEGPINFSFPTNFNNPQYGTLDSPGANNESPIRTYFILNEITLIFEWRSDKKIYLIFTGPGDKNIIRWWALRDFGPWKNLYAFFTPPLQFLLIYFQIKELTFYIKNTI